jgi:calcineurin-like phosphoesterase family protein
MKFYTSDWHLFHKKIIEYSNRPFRNDDGTPDVASMNRAIIDNINAVVGPDDELYLLGDVAFADANKTRNLMEQIVCWNIFLIPGNHDSDEIINLKRSDGSPMWKAVSPLMDIVDDGRRLVLCHYKFEVYNKAHYDEPKTAYQFYGHSHGSLPGNDQQIDVGVDCWDFKPVTLKEAQRRMKTLPPYKSKDHHVQQR